MFNELFSFSDTSSPSHCPIPFSLPFPPFPFSPPLPSHSLLSSSFRNYLLSPLSCLLSFSVFSLIFHLHHLCPFFFLPWRCQSFTWLQVVFLKGLLPDMLLSTVLHQSTTSLNLAIHMPRSLNKHLTGSQISLVQTAVFCFIPSSNFLIPSPFLLRVPQSSSS